jgi:hypothetical protein
MKAKRITSLASTGCSLALVVVGIVAIGPLQAKAEGYTIHEQTLVCGAQTSRGAMELNHGVGTTSLALDPISEFWSYSSVRPLVDEPQGILVRGTIEDTYADGQIVYSLDGIMVVQRVGRVNVRFITGTVTVIGGTGMFHGVSGTGQTKCVVSWDGHFSSSIEATLRILGQK